MRVSSAGLLLALSFVGESSFAGIETARLEISRDHVLVASIDGPAAEQFILWSGPGVTTTAADGTTRRVETVRDFADWNAGPVDPPVRARSYTVNFLCKACEPARGDTWRCYGVRYVPGRAGERGYIQIPRPGDDGYEVNVRTIYRGVEGQWFRATKEWDALIGARIRQALDAQRAAADATRGPVGARATAAEEVTRPKARGRRQFQLLPVTAVPLAN
jgi:hypothetical protein